MKMTNKQRAKIYRKAAEYIHRRKRKYEFGMCNAIRIAAPNWYGISEFMEFETMRGNFHPFNFWIPNTGIMNHNVRITALLLCSQMALDN